jgi:hypothetical protein
MRAGEGRGLESVIMSARQRAASLLESVASGRMSLDQALALWPDGRGDDPDVDAARGTLRRHPDDASALMARARALRAGPAAAPVRPRAAAGRPAAAGVRGNRVMLTRTRLFLVAAGAAALLVLSAYWILATR